MFLNLHFGGDSKTNSAVPSQSIRRLQHQRLWPALAVTGDPSSDNSCHLNTFELDISLATLSGSIMEVRHAIEISKIRKLMFVVFTY